MKFWQLVVVIIHNNILKFESFAKQILNFVPYFWTILFWK